jgi:hypothetical protein
MFSPTSFHDLDKSIRRRISTVFDAVLDFCARLTFDSLRHYVYRRTQKSPDGVKHSGTPVRWTDWCTPGMGVSLWGASPLYMNPTNMGNILVKVRAEGKGIVVRQCLKEASVQRYESRIRGDLSNGAAIIAAGVGLRAISKGVGLPPKPTAIMAAH